MSILPFFLGWTRNSWSSWVPGCSRMQRHKGTNQAECYGDCVWLCLGMAKKAFWIFSLMQLWFSPEITLICFGLWLYQLEKTWIIRPEEGKVLPFCVRLMIKLCMLMAFAKMLRMFDILTDKTFSLNPEDLISFVQLVLLLKCYRRDR